jgi:hypothetical protein
MIKDVELKLAYMESLNERQRRQFAALEANAIGWHGVSVVSEALNINAHTIRRGQEELASGEKYAVDSPIRRSGGGRKKNIRDSTAPGGKSS